MEKFLSWLIFYCCALFFELCNGYSFDLEDTASDQQTPLLTGIIGVLLTVCSLVFIVGCLCCQRRHDFKVFQNSSAVDCVTTETPDPGHVNPVANGEFTIFTPLSPIHLNNNGFHEQIFTRNLDNSNLNGYQSDMQQWFSENVKDFPRIKLKYVKELGTGKYGKVVEGQCLENNGDMWTPVVIRILDSSSTKEERIQFLKDTSMYRHGYHPNVLSLIGRCFETVPLLLIQEYCQGDLKSYLSRMSTTSESFTMNYTLLWCSQLTSALKFLHGYKFIHPDISSRNCQLNSNMNLKLGDYGLGMYKYPGDYYQNIPLRWCDPECLLFENHLLQMKQLSCQNNIWSLGVTLWEICECSQPYGNLTNENVLQLVKLKNKLTRPSRNTAWMDNIYQIMQMCWADLEIRPHIVEIDLLVGQLVEKYCNNPASEVKSLASSDDFDKKWEMLSPNTTADMNVSSDSVLVEMGDEYDVNTSKPLSPSMNNLHGSLDNLLEKCQKTEFQFEENLQENSCDSDSISETGSIEQDKALDNQYLKRILNNTNSGSESEDDNWRDKVKKGTYTEKVRVKSKSIADLMILTHVDYSESESETPFPSLNYKVNYKTPRTIPSKSEFPYTSFGSEGNLSSIQDSVCDKTKVNDELKKFHDEYFNSQLVPDNSGPKDVTKDQTGNTAPEFAGKLLEETPNVMRELNIQPQVFNLYNVFVDNLPYVNSKLNTYINFNSTSNPIEEAKIEHCRPVKSDPQLSNSYDEFCDSSLGVLAGNNTDGAIESRVSSVGGDQNGDDVANSTTGGRGSAPHATEHNESQIVEFSGNADKESSVDGDVAEVTATKVNSITETPVIPYLLFKTIPLKIQLENFSFIQLYDVIIEPHKQSDFISVLIDCLPTKTLVCNEDGELNNADDSGPKSIIFYYKTDADKSKDLSPESESFDVWSRPTGSDDENLNYSLETWDNFLGKTLDNQKERDDVFDNFSDELKSLVFPNDSENKGVTAPAETVLGDDCDKKDSLEGEEELADSESNTNTHNLTFTKEEDDGLNERNQDSDGTGWERNEGWYLHPQTKEELSGEMEIGSSSSDSYVGFGIDDELMSAVRDELIKKLPHAQGACAEQVVDDNEWDSQERDEVFLRYNVYNTPLPPIPEENLNEDDSDLDTPKGQCEDDSDWSAHCEVAQDTESHSSHTLEVPKHCHTLSESSCCSNDTLFNLEELNFAPVEMDKLLEQQTTDKNVKSDDVTRDGDGVVPDLNTTFVIESENLDNETQLKAEDSSVTKESPGQNDINDTTERDDCTTQEDVQQTNESHGSENTASLNETKNSETDSPQPSTQPEIHDAFGDDYEGKNYDTVNIDYSQYVDMENAKNSLEYEVSRKETDYINIIDKNTNSEDDNVYGMLADIRFNGPTDSQLMSTSFSESNTCDEKEWDSGSDSRSSSSGEFIWKEGEREESLKALKTHHQELEDVKPKEVTTENIFEESDISSTFSDDEDRETPEFVPSAWDKYAIPMKSALRSPEKTLNKTGKKKAKVCFKKQKYHCVYEYPKEPESPAYQKEVRWQNELKSFQDWEFDNEPCVTEVDDSDASTDYLRRSRGLSNSKNLYQLTDVSDFMSGMGSVDDKFFVSSSSRPFDKESSSSSQFFPGNTNWINVENATPDSGVEDIATPCTFIDKRDFANLTRTVPPLKQLAAECINKNKFGTSKPDDILGGLRHTRNKLKLELPPSPSAFTSGKMFSIDSSNHDAVPRENPTFTTFGKSRFLVQHIDTPNESNNRNVSFEALPYQPLNQVTKESQAKNVENSVSHQRITSSDAFTVGMETVKGEASLLDSADEDSGIESSTLEKKCNA